VLTSRDQMNIALFFLIVDFFSFIKIKISSNFLEKSQIPFKWMLTISLDGENNYWVEKFT